jgi:hypothetical protein
MTSDETRTCALNRCPNAAVTEEAGRIGGWNIVIPYCDEHARQMREGTPVGPLGIDPAKVVIEPVGADQPATQPGRFPGIA